MNGQMGRGKFFGGEGGCLQEGCEDWLLRELMARTA